jgi:hypothetical protein
VPADQADLGRHARLGRPAVHTLEHAALDLAAGDGRLDEDLRVDVAGGRERGVQFGPVGDPRDADARAGAGGLDERR